MIEMNRTQNSPEISTLEANPTHLQTNIVIIFFYNKSKFFSE